MATQLERLEQNVLELCRRCVRGQAAANNPSVWWNGALRVLSILLSSLGSVGVIADKASANLPGQTGWAFWGSVILLVFGIVSQIANEFQIAQRAAASHALAEKCDVYATRLENVLNEDDPRTDVVAMLLEVNKLFETEQYNRVLPPMTDAREQEAAARARGLITRNQGHWDLPERKLRGASPPKPHPPAPPAPPAAPPGGPPKP